MCGIAGVVTDVIDRSSAERRTWRIVNSQRSRGPDVQAVEAIPSSASVVVLGHSRLSIIDLSAAANQPMWDQARRYCLVYNGEIYNYLELRTELTACGHQFRTASDSEVLIEAFKEWGDGALNRFNGMFAFALLDASERRLILGRDRFGVKPLFYSLRGREFAFGSTCSVIAVEYGCGPNLEYLARGLHHQVFEDDSDETQYDRIFAVRPGETMAVQWEEADDIQVKRTRYYDFEREVSCRRQEFVGMRDIELIGEMLERLESAVSLRLRADVPVGISLSGGLDSSSIASLVAARHPQVHGFTFGAPGIRRSEAAIAKRFAAKTDVELHFVWPEPRAFIDGYFHTLEAQDAPFPTLSIVAQNLVFRAAREAGVVVLLGGQGADELLMGYRKFQIFVLQELLARRRFGQALGQLAWLLVTLVAETPQASLYLRHVPRYLKRHGLDSSVMVPKSGWIGAGFGEGGSPWQRQVTDVLRFSLPTLLRYEDRNSMGNSVESRLPFLDYRFAEAACAMPDVLKIRRGYGKWVLREGMRGRVPDEIRLARRKNGFDAIDGYWIRSGLGHAIRKALHERWPAVQRWLPRNAAIETLFSDDRLVGRVQTSVEATSLLWLSQRFGE